MVADPSFSFNFLTKLALNCPSFRKQSGIKWFAQPDINWFNESEVTCGQVWWPIYMVNLCSVFNPSKCTHRSEHTHTHRVNTHPEQWAAFYAAAPGEQLGVRCLAQGSHFSRGIEGGESAGYSLQNQNGLIIDTDKAFGELKRSACLPL